MFKKKPTQTNPKLHNTKKKPTNTSNNSSCFFFFFYQTIGILAQQEHWLWSALLFINMQSTWDSLGPLSEKRRTLGKEFLLEYPYTPTFRNLDKGILYKGILYKITLRETEPCFFILFITCQNKIWGKVQQGKKNQFTHLCSSKTWPFCSADALMFSSW